MTMFFGWVSLMLAVASLCTGVVAWRRSVLDREITPDRWLDTARREAWDLGLPFPEADGTLSRSAPVTALPAPKRPTGEQVARTLHERRLMAEPLVELFGHAQRLGMTEWEILRLPRHELVRRVLDLSTAGESD
jgi:hypothetical protein